jgi:hypothetical protein
MLSAALMAALAETVETGLAEPAETVRREVTVVASTLLPTKLLPSPVGPAQPQPPPQPTPATVATLARVAMVLAVMAEPAAMAALVEARLAGPPLAATAGLDFYFTRVAISNASGDS